MTESTWGKSIRKYGPDPQTRAHLMHFDDPDELRTHLYTGHALMDGNAEHRKLDQMHIDAHREGR